MGLLCSADILSINWDIDAGLFMYSNSPVRARNLWTWVLTGARRSGGGGAAAPGAHPGGSPSQSPEASPLFWDLQRGLDLPGSAARKHGRGLGPPRLSAPSPPPFAPVLN